jgi:hypothetical protein
VIVEVWKNVLVSVRVLDGDFELQDHASLIALPLFSSSEENQEKDSISIFTTVNSLLQSLSTSPDLFQPDITRIFKTHRIQLSKFSVFSFFSVFS